jgi:hypothetical protein
MCCWFIVTVPRPCPHSTKSLPAQPAACAAAQWPRLPGPQLRYTRTTANCRRLLTAPVNNPLRPTLLLLQRDCAMTLSIMTFISRACCCTVTATPPLTTTAAHDHNCCLPHLLTAPVHSMLSLVWCNTGQPLLWCPPQLPTAAVHKPLHPVALLLQRDCRNH